MAESVLSLQLGTQLKELDIFKVGYEIDPRGSKELGLMSQDDLEELFTPALLDFIETHQLVVRQVVGDYSLTFEYHHADGMDPYVDVKYYSYEELKALIRCAY